MTADLYENREAQTLTLGRGQLLENPTVAAC
jgi:hypothetical protein